MPPVNLKPNDPKFSLLDLPFEVLVLIAKCVVYRRDAFWYAILCKTTYKATEEACESLCIEFLTTALDSATVSQSRLDYALKIPSVACRLVNIPDDCRLGAIGTFTRVGTRCLFKTAPLSLLQTVMPDWFYGTDVCVIDVRHLHKYSGLLPASNTIDKYFPPCPAWSRFLNVLTFGRCDLLDELFRGCEKWDPNVYHNGTGVPGALDLADGNGRLSWSAKSHLFLRLHMIMFGHDDEPSNKQINMLGQLLASLIQAADWTITHALFEHLEAFTKSICACTTKDDSLACAESEKVAIWRTQWLDLSASTLAKRSYEIASCWNIMVDTALHAFDPYSSLQLIRGALLPRLYGHFSSLQTANATRTLVHATVNSLTLTVDGRPDFIRSLNAWQRRRAWTWVSEYAGMPLTTLFDEMKNHPIASGIPGVGLPMPFRYEFSDYLMCFLRQPYEISNILWLCQHWMIAHDYLIERAPWMHLHITGSNSAVMFLHSELQEISLQMRENVLYNTRGQGVVGVRARKKKAAYLYSRGSMWSTRMWKEPLCKDISYFTVVQLILAVIQIATLDQLEYMFKTPVANCTTCFVGGLELAVSDALWLYLTEKTATGTAEEANDVASAWNTGMFVKKDAKCVLEVIMPALVISTRDTFPTLFMSSKKHIREHLLVLEYRYIEMKCESKALSNPPFVTSRPTKLTWFGLL